MKDLPEEILDLIMHRLSERYSQDTWAHFRDANITPQTGVYVFDMHRTRLVCRTWNRLITKRLFNTVTLYYSADAADRDFESWNKLVTSKAIRGAAQRVVIQTFSTDNHKKWKFWSEEGEWLAFSSAMNRISELDHLQSVEVRFPKLFPDWMDIRDSNLDYKSREAREATLRSVLKALRGRETRQSHHARSGISAIRELKLENLPNSSVPSELTDGLFKGIEQLHILICHEHAEIDPGNTMTVELNERTEFESYLQYSILPPIAAQLVELTLGAHREWGLALGVFDGSNLDFPQLRTLSLSNYVIGHNTQFDWVLKQKTLKCLRLNSCHIITYMWIPLGSKEQLGINTEAWQEKSGESFFGEGESFVFHKRWANIFDSIREDLSGLTEFSLSWETSMEEFFRTLDPTGGNDGWESRYMAFDMGLLPNHFVPLQQFGWYPDFDEEDPEIPPNLPKFADESDRRALKALVGATQQRRQK
ncbi:f-box domain protein [Fusarium sp. NRRL 25303]|nr:f-box domain protein [Fusarium sp. NRRL 25303]